MISYEGTCGIHVSRHLKEQLVWAIDERFQLPGLIIKAVTPLRN